MRSYSDAEVVSRWTPPCASEPVGGSPERPHPTIY